MYEQDAAGVLSVLNAALLRQRRDFRFTTLVYAVLELTGSGGVLRASTGGHPPPILLGADGKARAIEAEGPLLGVMVDAEFADVEVGLAPGDALVFYTDGLTDAHAPEGLLSEDDLLRALEAEPAAGPAELADTLEELALGDKGRPPRDDVAIIALRLVG